MFAPRFREAVCEAFIANDLNTLDALVEPLRSEGPWVIGRAGSLLAGAPYELVAIDLDGLVLILRHQAEEVDEAGFTTTRYFVLEDEPGLAARAAAAQWLIRAEHIFNLWAMLDDDTSEALGESMLAH
jgi:hypothetical protein